MTIGANSPAGEMADFDCHEVPLKTARKMARVTGLEPATSGVTGRHSNRLSYTRAPPLTAACEAVVYGEAGALSSGRFQTSASMALDATKPS